MGDRRRRRMYLSKNCSCFSGQFDLYQSNKHFREESMFTNSYISLRDIPKFFHTMDKLPERFKDKHIAISNSKAIHNGDFYLIYDNRHEKLLLRYFSYNPDAEEYWRLVNIGDLVDCSSKGFIKQLNSLFSKNKLFFPVVAPVHHNPENSHRDQVRYFPLPPVPPSEKKNFLSDPYIKYIFVPTDSFVNSHKDADEVFDQLKGYFREYSDFENNENYMVGTDMYDLNVDLNLIEPVDGMDDIEIIGYERAKKELREIDVDEFLRGLSIVQSILNKPKNIT